jgi:proteasome lid subunit RPN8/RPN11
MTLRGVRRFRVGESTACATLELIQEAGRDGYELFAFWCGVRIGDVFNITGVRVPQQHSYKSEAGCRVDICGSELHRLNVWLYDTGQVIGVQVHSHPGPAYHSEADDAYSVATLDGSLSVVLPDFGAGGWKSEGMAAYRLWGNEWIAVTHPLNSLLEIVDDGNT